jgi:predicted PurR-regulated permease PerM
MQTKQYPFYFKSTVILFGIILVVFAMFHLQGILIPLAFAIIVSILLNPLMNRIHKAGVPRVLSIILTILIAIIFLGTILYFLSSQIAKFGDTLPLLKERFNQLLAELRSYLQTNFGIGIEKQVELLNQATEGSKGLITNTVGSALGTLGLLLLIPVYIFLFLFYKPLILNFLYEVFSEENSTEVVSDILKQTKSAIQSYMVGLLLEALIVATLNSTALLLLNVEYAILLGVMGALLNMLPYIGGLIAIALPVLMATVTKDGYQTQLGIIIAYMVIQFIDNNILVPRIVSSKVQINALISIVIVLLGGALWGLAGMFLSIPFVAILKIIFDRIEGLKPWGKLLGDEVPTKYRGQLWKRSKEKSVAEKIVSKT